jgi:hypothetical protein
VSQLRSWLESIGLGAHAERFERDRIDFIAHHAFVMVHLERNEPALALPQGQRSSALRSDIQRLIAQARSEGLLRNLPALERAADDAGWGLRESATGR